MTCVAVCCPIRTGGGVTEAFLTSLDMFASQGVETIAIVPEGFKFEERARARSKALVTVAGLEQGGALRTPLIAHRIATAAKENEADILLLNNGRHVRWVKRFAGKMPVAVIYHGGKIDRFVSADRVITINDDQRGFLISRGYPKDRVVVVDNALPVNEMPPYAARTPREPGTTIIGTLRLLEPAKGVDILIRAFAALIGQGVSAKLRIGSSGSEEAALKALAAALGVANTVEFCGWIGDKQAFYDSLDLYVLPSRFEEWGIGIVEANAASLPVVATACLGPKRILVNEETGLMVPVEDPDAMAKALKRLIDDPALAERLARAGHQRCAERYLFPTIAPLYVGEVLKTTLRT